MDEGALLRDLATGRLRAHVRWAGGLLLFSGLWPRSIIEGFPQFLWDSVPFSTAPQVLLALAPLLVGVGLLVASWRVRDVSVLALGAADGLLFLPLLACSVVSCDEEAGVLFSHRSTLAAVAVGLALAGIHAVEALGSPRAGRRLLAASGAAAALHFLWPWPGGSLLLQLGQLAILLLMHPSRALLSGLVLAVVALWPLLVLAVGVRAAPSRAPWSLVALLLLGGGPVLFLPTATRALLGQRGGAGDLAVSAGEALLLGVLLVLLTHAVSFLVRWGEVPRRAPLALAPLGVAALLVPWGVAPRKAAQTWSVAPASPAAERFFREELPAWNEQRRKLDLYGQGAAPSAPLLASARAIDPGLEQAVAKLVSDADDPGLTLAAWSRRVEDVNARSRALGLPFVVDATGKISERDAPARRWFRLDTYRIDGVGRLASAAALHLRALTPHRTPLGLLGLSRDRQPFALVVLDAGEIHARELDRLAALPAPRCAEHRASGPVEEALVRCGDQLHDLQSRGATRDALLYSVERHELQHQLDGARLPTAAVVARRLLWGDPEARAEINRELSAYLAEMTAPGDAPRVTLARLLRFLVLHRQGVERTVALLAFEALGDRDEIGLQPAAQVFLRLAALDSDALRARAASVWRAQYGKNLY